MRNIIKKTMFDVVERLVPNKQKQLQLIETPAYPTNLVCYEDAVTKFRAYCFDFNKVLLLLLGFYFLLYRKENSRQ
jgi:hypothetical protein